MGVTTDCLCANREALIDELQSNLEKLMQNSDVQEKCPSVSNSLDSLGLVEEFQTDDLQSLLNNNAALLCSDEDAVTGEKQVSSPRPTPLLPLVSAMKGSKGGSSRRLKVNWAADVYDPIPNSLSHTIKKKRSKSRKERDKSSNHCKRRYGRSGGHRGSSSREEKQDGRKNVTSSNAYAALIMCDELGNPPRHDLPIDLDVHLHVFDLDFST